MAAARIGPVEFIGAEHLNMRWASAISRHSAVEQAIDELSAAIVDALDGEPDVAFVFASEHLRDSFDLLPRQLRARLGGCTLLGSSASGVIGAEQEIEFQPALSVLAATLPDVVLDSWHVEMGDLAPGSAHSERCANLAAADDSPPQYLVLADPFTFPVERLLQSLEQGRSPAQIAGGLVSGGRAAGEVALFQDDRVLRSGALLMSLRGNVEIETLVAQGCRPIGEPMFLTGHNANEIIALDDTPPLEVLNELYLEADAAERQLMQHSLFVGVGMRAGESRYGQGDFLIRNLIGADRTSGTVSVSAELYPTQVVQFHLRDAHTSAEDLERVLARSAAGGGAVAPEGALLFSCTGRGKGLYGESGHDSGAFHDHFGPVPLGGLFCNGEIGPVQGRTFLHGYTSAFVMFRPRQPGSYSR